LSYTRDTAHDTGKRVFAQLESCRVINGLAAMTAIFFSQH